MRIFTFKRMLGLGAIYGAVRYAQKQGVTLDNVGDKLKGLLASVMGTAKDTMKPASATDTAAPRTRSASGTTPPSEHPVPSYGSNGFNTYGFGSDGNNRR